MSEITLTTLFGDGEYTAGAYNDGSPGAIFGYSFTLVKYTQDQGQNPSNNSAYRFVLDGFPDPILSASLAGFWSYSFPEKDCSPEHNCSEWTGVTADIFGAVSVNDAGLVFFPLKNHDGGAYVRAAAKCPCNDSTKSRTVLAQVDVRTGSASHPILIQIIPCTNCDAVPEVLAKKQRHEPSTSMVGRIDESFALLRAWNEYKI